MKIRVAINDDIAVLSCDSVWAGWGGTVAKTGGKDTRQIIKQIIARRNLLCTINP
jgi:hypothetical protein